MDFNPKTNVTTLVDDASSWIPTSAIASNVKGVYHQDGIFLCSRYGACKHFPIGHDEWIDVPSLNATERYLPAMAVVGGKVLVTGGRMGTITLKTTELFDGESWTYGPDMPEGRFSHAVVAYTAMEILMYSGYSKPSNTVVLGNMATVYTYDFSDPNSGWVQKTDMPQKAHGVTVGHLR